MYEDITYDVILKRMLLRVPSSVDKREGSIIYDAIAPCALELALMYREFDAILDETFADTATRQYLIRRAKERGLEPYPSTKALLKAVSTPASLELSVGERFSLDNLTYAITSKIANGQYQIECETYGTEGNKHFGRLVPINYINGLETIEITELLIPAEDEEETETFRKRYINSFEHSAYGGNVYDYIEKTNSLLGVGSTKVTPVWNGGGTVRLTILNSAYDVASQTLVSDVQEAIDPTQDGTGYGIAPIGHIVTVDTPEEVDIDVSATFTLQTGYTFEDVLSGLEDAVSDYLLELRKVWADSDTLVVRISQIERRMLDVDGIVDITGTTINETTSNIELTAYQVPVLGVITYAENS